MDDQNPPPPAAPRCAHCDTDIENRGDPSIDGNHETRWVHVPGGYRTCYPQQLISPYATPAPATATGNDALTARQARRDALRDLITRVGRGRAGADIGTLLRDHLNAELADADQAHAEVTATRTGIGTLRREHEAHRAAVSEALGHHTDADWDALISTAQGCRDSRQRWKDAATEQQKRASNAEQRAKTAEEELRRIRSGGLYRQIRHTANYPLLADAPDTDRAVRAYARNLERWVPEDALPDQQPGRDDDPASTNSPPSTGRDDVTAPTTPEPRCPNMSHHGRCLLTAGHDPETDHAYPQPATPGPDAHYPGGPLSGAHPGPAQDCQQPACLRQQLDQARAADGEHRRSLAALLDLPFTATWLDVTRAVIEARRAVALVADAERRQQATESRVRATADQLDTFASTALKTPDRELYTTLARSMRATLDAPQPNRCTAHPRSPVINGHCGGCTHYPPDMLIRTHAYQGTGGPCTAPVDGQPCATPRNGHDLTAPVIADLPANSTRRPICYCGREIEPGENHHLCYPGMGDE